MQILHYDVKVTVRLYIKFISISNFHPHIMQKHRSFLNAATAHEYDQIFTMTTGNHNILSRMSQRPSNDLTGLIKMHS